MKGSTQKIILKEDKPIGSVIYLLMVMSFQMLIYVAQEILASEVLKRILLSLNFMAGAGILISLGFYVILKKQK